MNKRILAIRKSRGMTQEEFAATIGTSRVNLSKIETGVVTPTEMFIKVICTKYNVDEIWLRTGVGEMFKTSANDDEETAAWLGQVLNATGTTKNLLVKNLRHLTDEEWDAIGRIALKMLQGHEDKEKEPGE